MSNVPNYTEQGGAKTVIGGEIDIASGGKFSLAGVDKAAILAKLTGLTVAALDGTTGKKACLTNGLSVITGGTGIADMSLAAPSPGEVAIIRIDTLTSGSVVVTGGTNVKLSGLNIKATFDAVGEALVLVYKATNTWEVALNIGGVVLAAS
ncbi:hypothetical protein LPY66_18200 [Dehalobacter sp. DCM]|uniref:hypothetical protein n=1 Tax=Dehalobacter sp. DCM TaxID=2907827 RepID=UPI0030820AB7|nr:hypothetical protein LPY66_18200 [Dehalobacter sp. DCM]